MNRRARLAALSVLLGAWLGSARPASAGAGVRWLKGPYLQNAASNAITVMWETDVVLPAHIVITGPDGARTIPVAAAERPEIVIDGLRAGTTYRYSVFVGADHVDGELSTAPEPGADTPITFAVLGDTRSNTESHRRVVERVRADAPDFILATGDMVDDGSKEPEWQSFFDIERELLRDNVLYPSIGNHDRQGRGRTADDFRALFAVPENSPDPERYYAFTYGQSRFLVLDSNAYSFALTDQTGWIEHELEAASQDLGIHHVFVVMHHPPYSISLHGGQRDLRERWTPLFEKYGVDAVFSGHDHVYERAEVNGVRYFVSGGGGASLYPRKAHPAPIDVAAIAYFERVNHFLRVHVAGDQVEITAVRVDGSPIETLAWTVPPRHPTPAAAVAAAGAPAPTVGPPAVAPAPAVTPETPERAGRGWMFGVGTLLLAAAGFGLWRALRS